MPNKLNKQILWHRYWWSLHILINSRIMANILDKRYFNCILYYCQLMAIKANGMIECVALQSWADPSDSIHPFRQVTKVRFCGPHSILKFSFFGLLLPADPPLDGFHSLSFIWSHWLIYLTSPTPRYSFGRVYDLMHWESNFMRQSMAFVQLFGK